MLFYTKNKDDIQDIPETYLVLILSNSIKNISHSNYRRVNLNPSINFSSECDKKELKKRYLKKIKKEYKNQIAAIVQAACRTDQLNSIVMVYNDKYEFDYMKVICKYIEDRYNYKCFKFTNTITRDMRKLSKIDKEGQIRLSEDLIDMTSYIICD